MASLCALVVAQYLQKFPNRKVRRAGQTLKLGTLNAFVLRWHIVTMTQSD